ncbi:MAG TPA: alpha-L-arabinofuranosidase C-terminal domain-containing protein, partial [Tepidisphaeraceae bacterium]|nr:alpha-L-arabinofuranosidase C-terminal domain-containing protein [Tepidisphaeraceae bacterium]
RLGDAQVQKLVNGEIVSGKDPKASNSFENPNNVVGQAFKDATVANGVATMKLPPLSVVAATFELA